jgi:HEAT repeat protein
MLNNPGRQNMSYKLLKESIKNGIGDPYVVTCLLLQYGSRALKPLFSGLTSPSIEMRSYSVECLGFLGDIRAVRPLIEMFKDSDNEPFFFELGNTIGQLCMWENMNIIYNALRSKEKQIRQHIAFLLDDYGDEKIFPVLIKALKDTNTEVFINICRAINAWSVYLKDRDVASKALTYYLNDENPSKRKAIVASLNNAGNLRTARDIIKAIQNFPTDEEFKSKALISLAGILKNYEHNLKAQMLKEFILNTDFTWKKRLQSLILEEDEIPEAENWPENSDFQPGQSEAFGVEEITAGIPIQDLSEITRTSEKELNTKISESEIVEEQICGKSTRELCSLLYVNDHEGQLTAIRCLTKRADKKALETYKILLLSKKCLVRLEIAHAMGKLKNQSAVPLLAAVYETAWLELRAQIVRSYGDIGGKSIINHLITALHDKHPKIRYIAAGKLQDNLNPKALKAIKMALGKEKNKYVKEAMERVIVRFNQ